MVSSKVAEISRSDLKSFKPSTATITDVKHLSSYNWLNASKPTIVIPGIPPLWSPPKAARQLQKDSGIIYIAQNAARHPESPLEPLFRALYVSDPSFEIQQVDLVTDRNNIRKLLSFVNPNLSRDRLEPFTIDVEVIRNTAIFCRAETKTMQYVGPKDFIGFGHEFEKKYTTNQLDGSTGHHRIISYQFGDMKLLVRNETDGYIDLLPKESVIAQEAEPENLSNMLGSLSLGLSDSPISKLVVKEDGQAVPIESTLEIKTRVSHRPINVEEVLPQLWISQTPNLVRAYHKNGLFQLPQVENLTPEIRKWEEDHQSDLKALAVVMKKIIEVVRESGGKWRKRDCQMTSILNSITLTAKVELSENLNEITESRSSKKTTVKVGDILFDIDLRMIPYLASFVQEQRGTRPLTSEFVHSTIPLFDTALKGLELGFWHCFRSLRADLSQYHTLCDTYHFLKVDVLERQSINEVFVNLRSCKLDYDDYGPVKGNKSTARDAAFRLLFLMLQSEPQDKLKMSNKVYNAVFFVVSHPATFKWCTRIVVRAAYEEQYIISSKQKATLDKWKIGNQFSDDDKTTEEEFSDYLYYSDDSF
ncbi:hypothetical protein BJX70DRAFT_401493 [Aspergillus crustosus]